MGPVAEDIVDVDVRGVGLERDAVVAVVDVQVVQRHVARVVDVHAVRLSIRLASQSPSVGSRDDREVVEDDVLAGVDEERPARALADVQVADDEIVCAVSEHKVRWAQGVVGNLTKRYVSRQSYMRDCMHSRVRRRTFDRYRRWFQCPRRQG